MRARLRRPAPRRRPPEAAPEAAPTVGRPGLLHRRTPAAQTALQVSRPGDAREREAGRMAEQALAGPVSARRPTATEPDALPEAVQDGFRAQFGEDLRGVRVRRDRGAAVLTQAARAEAVALGDQIAVAPTVPGSDTPQGWGLLAHEAAHVVQARRETGGTPVLARRMIVGGTPDDVSALLSLLAPPAGLTLAWDPSTREVTITGPGPDGATPSPTLSTLLDEVIGHPTQHAEVVVGVDQPGIVVGGFPLPNDFTGSRVQRIDIDDVLALEAGAPGNGVAKAAHEIDENFQAHAEVPQRGTDQYDPAHEHAVEVESDIAEELVGPGRRAAEGVWKFQKDGTIVSADDFGTYYLVTVMRLGDAVPGTSQTPVEIVSAERVGRIVLTADTVDAFASGSDTIPPSPATTVAALLLHSDPLGTIRIEGHTDGVGSDESNDTLGLRRAESARDAIASLMGNADLVGERIHVVSLGEREPVADNDTEAGRAQNRRVVIEVTAPDYP